MNRCVIISGSPDSDAYFIKSQINPSDFIICADKGYEYAQRAGIKPNLLVGDFDSLIQVPDNNVEIVSLNTHKDDTDTMHCVAIAIERCYSDIVILGGIGGRFDHTFANLCTLEYASNRGANVTLVRENEIVEFKSKGTYEYNNLKGCTFSLFPFGCNEAVISYIGDVEYPLTHHPVTSYSALGVSNIFNSDSVKIAVEEGQVLVFIEKNV